MITTRTGIILRTLAVLVLTALVAATLPAAPARADGAASTRNIILGGALAAGTLLIINHNKKVHQKEDELSNARNQAEAQRDQAYSSASTLRSQLAAENREMVALKRQLAQQHQQIEQLRKQVSGTGGNTRNPFIAPTPRVGSQAPSTRVASTSMAYGWGQL